ncbi:PREDICTED: uncharacterized protein LOC101309389 isoform X2 [Fragaria vesca subsp. vesca]|uniref:uncharacterized protein LOC101309389 isoform X2 n=1 Tax=Fragaria vesca subsp. vesca TaxID=101020 RepID=UPI0002C34AE0|nr:PREDICTED: uncharacterized protein LOC101309389 isoform X2 [Fragaria vesca subsp. vesca]
MAGFDASESQQQQTQLFSVGTEVEVRSDEEGFKGAWFRATIVQSPAPSSASKKRKKAVVEYKTLVTEDGSQPLKEHVDSAYIRPLPPHVADQDLEEGHIVDADYRDGWWTGVIRKVIKKNSKYSIFFENPPDVLEFDRDRLRLHEDWVAGIWVRPNKQEILGASDSQPEEEHLVKLLPVQNGSNHPEVSQVAAQQKTTGAAGDNPESTNSMKNLEEQSSYTQSIKDVAPNGIATDSRPLKKLKDDKVSEATSSGTPRQLRKTPNDKEILSELATGSMESSGTRGSRRVRKPALSHQLFQVESLHGEKKVKTKQQKDGELDNQMHSVKSKGRRSQALVGSSQEAVICALPSQEKHKERGKEDYRVIGSAGNVVQKEGISKEAELPLITGSQVNGKEAAQYPCEIPNEELLKLMIDQKKNANGQAQEESTDFKQQPTDLSSHKRKRGRPRKLVIVSSQASQGVRELNGSNVADKIALEDQRLDEVALHVPEGQDASDSQDASRRNTADVPGTRGIPNEAARIRVQASQNTDDDDRPLSTWFGGMQGAANMDELSKTVEQVRHARDSTPVDSVNDSVPPDENQIMPFVKSSPIWKAIESFDVFRIMPQNPHFRPLVKCKEEYREGFAIGNMVTFSSLVDKISSLHFDDPTQVFDSILESLLDLEKYGFNVTILRGRVNELLSIKQRQVQFEGKSKDAESKIVKQTHEKSKLEVEADSIKKRITELQEKHALIKAAIGSKERDIASLQSSADAINESIKNARSDFEKTTLLPLR